MAWNPDKFQLLRYGNRDLSNQNLLFTPNYDNPICEVDIAKDLGIQMDNNFDFEFHRNKVVSKTNNKCSWILRTFYTRDMYILNTLWKSLARPHQDYGSIIWAPVSNTGDMEVQEGPQRSFTKYYSGTKNMNYWQRLKYAKLLSIQRRNERFRLFYIWKSIYGGVPSLGFTTVKHERRGIIIKYPKYKCNIQ